MTNFKKSELAIRKELAKFFSTNKQKFLKQWSSVLKQELIDKCRPCRKILMPKIAKTTESIYKNLVSHLESPQKHKKHKFIQNFVKEFHKLDMPASCLITVILTLKKVVSFELVSRSPLKNNQVKNLLQCFCDEMDTYVLEITDFYAKVREKTLKESEMKYCSIINSINDGLVIIDKSKKLTFCNGYFTKMAGYTEKELLNKKITDLIYTEDDFGINKYFDRVFNKKTVPQIFRARLHTKKGDIRFIELNAKATSNRGKTVAIESIIRDRTTLRETEKKSEERLENMHSAYLEVGRVNRIMASLIDISSVIASDLPSNDIFDFILASSVMLTEADTGTIRAYDAKKKALILKASYGLGEEWKKVYSLNVKNSVSGDAVSEKTPIKISDVKKDKAHDYAALTKEHNFRSVYSIPLMIRGKVVGSISFLSRAPNKFTKLDNDLIEGLVNQAAVALKIYS